MLNRKQHKTTKLINKSNNHTIIACIICWVIAILSIVYILSSAPDVTPEVKEGEYLYNHYMFFISTTCIMAVSGLYLLMKIIFNR